MANAPGKFFSVALEAAKRIKQKRGTGQQLKSMLRTYGAKQKELDYLDVDKQYKGADMHYIDLPPRLIEELQKRGAVPFFKDGGEV